MESQKINGHMDKKPRTDLRKSKINATNHANLLQDNVWDWIHEVSATSPIQPVVNLGTSFFDFAPPQFIIEAHREALGSAEGNQYAPTMGTQALRNAIARIWSASQGRDLNPNTEICVCNGAQEALLSTIMAFLEPGDEVIVFEPVFELYIAQLKLVGASIIYVPLRAPECTAEEKMTAEDWKFDANELEEAIGTRTKAIILNNPHNPLGKVFTPAEIRLIGDVCISHDLLLIADEVYERIAFGCVFTPAASIDQRIAARTITTISFGKLFNATGWRVGFAVGIPEHIQAVQTMHVLLAYASSSPAQEACAKGLLAAEENGFWAENRREVAIRVKRICGVLDDIGLPYIEPLAAYFIFVNIEKIRIPSEYQFPELVMRHGSKDWKVCYFMVNDFGIASIPGSCFYGPKNAHYGRKYVRLGVFKSPASLDLAEERLRKLETVIE